MKHSAIILWICISLSYMPMMWYEEMETWSMTTSCYMSPGLPRMYKPTSGFHEKRALLDLSKNGSCLSSGFLFLYAQNMFFWSWALTPPFFVTQHSEYLWNLQYSLWVRVNSKTTRKDTPRSQEAIRISESQEGPQWRIFYDTSVSDHWGAVVVQWCQPVCPSQRDACTPSSWPLCAESLLDEPINLLTNWGQLWNGQTRKGLGCIYGSHTSASLYTRMERQAWHQHESHWGLLVA